MAVMSLLSLASVFRSACTSLKIDNRRKTDVIAHLGRSNNNHVIATENISARFLDIVVNDLVSTRQLLARQRKHHQKLKSTIPASDWHKRYAAGDLDDVGFMTFHRDSSFSADTSTSTAQGCSILLSRFES